MVSPFEVSARLPAGPSTDKGAFDHDPNSGVWILLIALERWLLIPFSMPAFGEGKLSIKPVNPQIIPTLHKVLHLICFWHMILQPCFILSLSFPVFPLYSLLHLVLFQLLLHSQHKLQVCKTAAEYGLTSCSCFLSSSVLNLPFCRQATETLWPVSISLASEFLSPPKPSNLFLSSPLLAESQN